jgi:UDP:flavonoid glycosyltransferase YjiC (YdhE family)
LELAAALATQGAAVTVACHAKHRSLLKSLGRGLLFADCGLEPVQARKATASGQALEAVKTDPSLVGPALSAFVFELVGDWFAKGLALLIADPLGSSGKRQDSPDCVVLATPAATYCLAGICDEYALPFVVLDANPLFSSNLFPPPKAFRGVAAVGAEPTNVGQWAIWQETTWRFLYRDAVNACRTGSGLEPYGPGASASPLARLLQPNGGVAAPVLLCYQPELLPRDPSWPPHVHVCGLMGGGLGPLPEQDPGGKCLPDALKAFFGADLASPVVLVSLGLVGDQWQDAAARNALLAQCLEAFTLANVRCVVVVPPGCRLPGQYLADGYRCLSLPALPTGAEMVVMRKCCCVVSSGDAWTVQAAARAGTPSLTLRLSGGAATNNHEHSAEAEFWGRAVCAAGCAPPPLAGASLKVSALAAHVTRLSTPGSAERQRAVALAEAMRSSKHCGMAVAAKIVGGLAASVAAIRAAAFNAEE